MVSAIGQLMFLINLGSVISGTGIYLIELAMMALGSLVFCVGLLLHTLRLRVRGNRVTELEAISGKGS